MQGYIYTLCDPRNKEVRYVGLTIDVALRLRQHCRPAKYNSPKNAWLKELTDAGLQPEMQVIETVPDGGHASQHPRERYWIERLKSEGAQLFNRKR